MVLLVQHLTVLNNFHSATAVLAALTSSVIQELPVARESGEQIQKVIIFYLFIYFFLKKSISMQLEQALAEKKESKGLAGCAVVPFAPDFLKDVVSNVTADWESLASTTNPTIDWPLQASMANALSRIAEQQRVCNYRFPAGGAPSRLQLSIQQSIAVAANSPALARRRDDSNAAAPAPSGGDLSSVLQRVRNTK